MGFVTKRRLQARQGVEAGRQRDPATRVEGATGGGIDGARHLALQGFHRLPRPTTGTAASSARV
jgi:hypothetical protein